ncbi:MAG TPA: hypothetical protein VGM07_15405 [Stellaceae bacterium]|jgi:hypothetical protein
MSRADEKMGKPANFESDLAVWRYCRAIDAPEDEAERFLDLAGFADDLLEEEERERIGFLLGCDPAAAADVAAARMLSASSGAAPAADEHRIAGIIARADALGDDAARAPVRVLPFRTAPPPSILHRFAQWGSLAAAIVVASWLGFTMGSGASSMLSQPSQAASQTNEASFLPELLDPSTGFLRDLVEGQQT